MEANEEHAKIAAAKDFDPEAFDVVFDKKDELIKELEQLDKGFSTVYTRVKEELIGNKEAYKEEIEKMQKELPSDSFRMGLTMMVALPLVIAYPFFQKFFVKGITIGGVKG